MKSDFSQKQMQVAEKIKRIFSVLLKEGEFGEDLGAEITVTEVRISGGLKHAEIFIVAANRDKGIDAIKNMNEQKGAIKKVLASRLGLRFMPEIVFKEDKSLDSVKRVEELLASDEVKKDVEED